MRLRTCLARCFGILTTFLRIEGVMAVSIMELYSSNVALSSTKCDQRKDLCKTIPQRGGANTRNDFRVQDASSR